MFERVQFVQYFLVVVLFAAILPYFLSTISRPRELPLLNTNTASAASPMLSAPLPSPLEENPEIWDMDNVVDIIEVQSNQEPQERADQPE